MKEHLDQYLDDLQNRTPAEVIACMTDRFRGQCIFSTSMGAEDQALTHILAGSFPDIPVFTLDTGRLFQETYDLIRITEEKYGMKIRVYFPDQADVEQMVNHKGINLFYDSVANRKECCRVRKVEPLKRALKGMKVWITGLRREQSSERGLINTVEWDEGQGILKLNPLADWSREYLWEFIRENKIPYNSLHDKGFLSLGCLPCTRAVLPGEEERAGRWWWEEGAKKECGLHTDEH